MTVEGGVAHWPRKSIKSGKMHCIDGAQAVGVADLDGSGRATRIDGHDNHGIEVGPRCVGEISSGVWVSREAMESEKEFGTGEVCDAPHIGVIHGGQDQVVVRPERIAFHQGTRIDG